jgi:hypothetical protein
VKAETPQFRLDLGCLAAKLSVVGTVHCQLSRQCPEQCVPTVAAFEAPAHGALLRCFEAPGVKLGEFLEQRQCQAFIHLVVFIFDAASFNKYLKLAWAEEAFQ